MRAFYGGTATIHPTEAVSASAERDTLSGRVQVTVYLTDASVNELRKTFALADKYHIHLGHAFWHIHEHNPAPCELCKLDAEQKGV